jgi:hypothetical protein
MNREELLKKAEAALEKNLDILTEQNQPLQSELAVKAIPMLVNLIESLSR